MQHLATSIVVHFLERVRAVMLALKEPLEILEMANNTAWRALNKFYACCFKLEEVRLTHKGRLCFGPRQHGRSFRGCENCVFFGRAIFDNFWSPTSPALRFLAVSRFSCFNFAFFSFLFCHVLFVLFCVLLYCLMHASMCLSYPDSPCLISTIFDNDKLL